MSFDDACRTMLGKFYDTPVPEHAMISVEVEGGGQVQIGDCTWDTEPYKFVIEAWIPGGTKKGRNHWRRTFDTLPDLWNALEEEGTKEEPL